MPTNEQYQQAAVDLGKALVSSGYGLVYGGAGIGLMGILARTVMESGGHVCGIIPHLLQTREVSNLDLSEVHIVEGMQERKRMMAQKASAFVALPGGLGTLDELFECLSCSSLGIHRKPVGLLNVAGYYDKLLEFLHNGVSAGFVTSDQYNSIQVAERPEALLELFSHYQPMPLPRWLNAATNSNSSLAARAAI